MTAIAGLDSKVCRRNVSDLRKAMSGLGGSPHSLGVGEFVADDVHVARGINAQADGVRSDAYDRNRDVLADQNLFARLP